MLLLSSNFTIPQHQYVLFGRERKQRKPEITKIDLHHQIKFRLMPYISIGEEATVSEQLDLFTCILYFFFKYLNMKQRVAFQLISLDNIIHLFVIT